jgi:hypothetical protein
VGISEDERSREEARRRLDSISSIFTVLPYVYF